MGKHIDYINCPRCNSNECIDEYNYKTDESDIFCSECGYTESTCYRRNDDGSLAKIDESGGTEWHNLIMDNEKIEAYAAYSLKRFEGYGEIGSLNTEDDYHTFVSEIVFLINQPNDFQSVIVSRFVDNQIQKEIIYEAK
jgi:hypothetical protein